ncbi:MAG: 50S ribosomal protein L9 [Bdellovibrionales bacterium]|nr:50S ribosomal protein L9 [Bdellovibrionales bacterium]
MKVILKSDVKDLGKVGELVNVSTGFARNFLFPRKLAAEATEKRVKEFEHWQRVAESRQKKAVEERRGLLDKIAGLQLVFSLNAGEEDKLFGSVTNKDISDELEKQGYSVDKRDIQLPEAIKVLGQHKAVINMGNGLEQEIIITVERLSQKS